MGSYAQATMTGFICRLCSEHKKCVIHFYSAKAQELELLKKLTLLPITVEKYDNLPKTICQECIEKLDLQYHLVQKIRKSLATQRKHRLFHLQSNGRCPVECPLHGITAFETVVEESNSVNGLVVQQEGPNILVESDQNSFGNSVSFGIGSMTNSINPFG